MNESIKFGQLIEKLKDLVPNLITDHIVSVKLLANLDALTALALFDDGSNVREHLKALGTLLQNHVVLYPKNDWEPFYDAIRNQDYVTNHLASGEVLIELLADNPDMNMNLLPFVGRIERAIEEIPTVEASLIMDLNVLLKTQVAGVRKEEFEADLMAKIVSVYFRSTQNYSPEDWQYKALAALFDLPESSDLSEFFFPIDEENIIASFKGQTHTQRGLYNTIVDIKAVVPALFTVIHDQLYFLLGIVGSVPKEHHSHWWTQVTKVFENSIPLVVTEDWQFKVLSILNQLPLKQTRKLFGAQEAIKSVIENHRVFDAQEISAFIKRSSVSEEVGQKILTYVQAALLIKYGATDDMSPIFGFHYMNPQLKASGYIVLWVIDSGDVKDSVKDFAGITLALAEGQTQFNRAEAVWQGKGPTLDIDVAIEKNLTEILNG